MNDWVLIRSWHKVKLVTRASWYKTVCGRIAKEDALVADNLPAFVKSCESCLRIISRNAEKNVGM